MAEATPELIYKVPVDITKGVTKDQCEFIATSLGFDKGTQGHTECMGVAEKLYKMFVTHDCTLVEVNLEHVLVTADLQVGKNPELRPDLSKPSQLIQINIALPLMAPKLAIGTSQSRQGGNTLW